MSLALNNFAKAISLAMDWSSWFETASEIPTKYNWIYEFEAELPFEQQQFLFEDHALFATHDASIVPSQRLVRLVPCLALLATDQAAFLALSHLQASFRSFQTCLHCAIRGERKHQHHEPQPWQYPHVLSDLENAAIQAVMAIETLVGKPGNRERVKATDRIGERWRHAFGSSHDDEFLDSGETVLDEYYRAFSVRNDCAHAWRALEPSLRLESTLRCQLLSFELCCSYIETRLLPLPSAMSRLHVESPFDGAGNGGG